MKRKVADSMLVIHFGDTSDQGVSCTDGVLRTGVVLTVGNSIDAFPTQRSGTSRESRSCWHKKKCFVRRAILGAFESQSLYISQPTPLLRDMDVQRPVCPKGTGSNRCVFFGRTCAEKAVPSFHGRRSRNAYSAELLSEGGTLVGTGDQCDIPAFIPLAAAMPWRSTVVLRKERSSLITSKLQMKFSFQPKSIQAMASASCDRITSASCLLLAHVQIKVWTSARLPLLARFHRISSHLLPHTQPDMQ